MIIGILGGMGSYATLNIFERILSLFPAEKEWDRPRILIDNNCTMPSRVVAALYGRDRDKLVKEMSSSVKHLIESGATHIFLACNTSHIFLEDVYKNVPEAKGKIYSIIETLAQDINEKKINEPFALIATEGTLETKIYQKIFEPYHIQIIQPDEEKFSLMRELIEAVKQNNLSNEHCKKFIQLIKSFNLNNIILGCTEFPVLYSAFKNEIDSTGLNIYDPLESTIQKLHKIYVSEAK
ncbi:amino acid racemase [Treponema sp.]|uniref:aspartate/glutamate racemase family protein n=1 Tax=Treponema sp. TaxID=166 RepID=UPI0025F040DC|nr:amino acid racemase [Treponema sp.]MCR5217212.1 amino acid racemase [Treponema sp.]